MIKYLSVLVFILGIFMLVKVHADEKPVSWQRSVPEPVFDKEPAYVDLYWKAWAQAWTHVKTQPGLAQSPYMDEACWDTHIWIWDTAFMALFTRYSPKYFPGIESLKNFYDPLFGSGKSISLKIQHPDNPPLFPWCEYENWRFNGATSFGKGKVAARKSLEMMKKYYNWFNTLKPGTSLGGCKTVLRRINDSKGKLKGFLWNGIASGMDNTVRGRGAGWDKTLWVDAISQQALAALCISRMASDLGDSATATDYAEKHAQLKETINTLYWDDKDGTYYDIDKNSTKQKKMFVKVLTPASIWPLLAEVASNEQARRVASLLKNPNKLGGAVPVVTLSRDDPQFNSATGDYWRGAIWLPTSYMAVKALEVYNLYPLADDIAEKTVSHMLATYKNPEAIKLNKGKPTIWECYNPNKALPSTERGRTARPNFCGWSALGPISLFIENILGFHTIDARAKKIEWRLHQTGRHGIKNLKFGDILTDIVYDGKSSVLVKSNAPYVLIINGVHRRIASGTNTIEIHREQSPGGDVPKPAPQE